MRLESLQRSMMRAIGRGPACVDHGAFLGSESGVLRGFAVHANTISHARLVALEETFPRTRGFMGDAKFNALSRSFTETRQCAEEPLAAIGRNFGDWLESRGNMDAAPLARFEWAWLECFHAADADALALSDLAGLPETELLATRLVLHPAARLTGPVPHEALAGELPETAGAPALLFTRPRSSVIVSPANGAVARRFEGLASPQPICNLLATGDEEAGEDGLKPLLAMIEAGSLVLAN